MGGNPVITPASNGTNILLHLIPYCYAIAISVIAILMIVNSKNNQKQNKKAFLIIAAIGGATAMYITISATHRQEQYQELTKALPKIMVIHFLAVVGIPVLILLSVFVRLIF